MLAVELTGVPSASTTETWTAGLMFVSAVVLAGCTVNASPAAGPAFTVSVTGTALCELWGRLPEPPPL